MAPRDLVLGMDSSTTACKAIVWDLHGNPVAEGRAPIELIQPAPHHYEQRAEDWWKAACRAIHEALERADASRLAALAIAHQRESFVLLGNDGQPLRNAILWMDERAAPLLPELERQLDADAFHRRTGKPLTGNLIPGKLAWLGIYEPHKFYRQALILDTAAYLCYQLTGQARTSIGSADPTGLYDISGQCWDTPTIAYLGLTSTQLPELVQTGEVIGFVTPQAAAQTGLPPGIPVVAGLGDGQANSLGLGVVTPGSASLSLGTSVITGSHADHFVTSPAFRTMTGGAPESYLCETVLLGGGFTLRWLLKDFLHSDLSYADFDALAEQVRPGSDGLILLPYWNTAMNPYWDADASGAVIGWRGNHGPAHFYRAALEGVGFELRLEMEHVEVALGTRIETIIASGGGTYSSTWLAIIASILGKPLSISRTPEATALGAGILAAAGAGLFASIDEACRQMSSRPAQVISPDPVLTGVYAKVYTEVYLGLYPALRDTMRRLSATSRLA